MANLELGAPIGNVRLTDAGRASCRTRRQRLPHSRMGGEAVHGLQVGARRHRTEPQDLGAPNPRASTRPGA